MTDAAQSERALSDEDLRRPAASRLAVLGQPISHSKSPAIHAAAYEILGLPWEYEAVECGETGLAGFLDSLGPEWRGLSLTMPLKEEARRLAAVVDPVAAESGVVNTLLRLVNGSHGADGTPTARTSKAQWAGFNTDVPGLAAAIRDAGLDARSTVVIGSGATAVSAVLAVRRLGAEEVTIVARNAAAMAELVDRFDGTGEPGSDAHLRVRALSYAESAVNAEAVLGASLIVSTVPGGAAADVVLPDGAERVPLFDVAYDPWPSPLAERWTAAGGVAHAGLDMLVEQALVQIRVFVHGDPRIALGDEDALLAAMRAASVER